MAWVEGETVIRRPVEEVFDYVADERHEPAYNPRMARSAKVTDGPVGVGTRFEAHMATRPRPMRMVSELTAFERPHRLELRTTSAFAEVSGRMTFDAVDGGTRMRWSWQLHPHGALRLAGPALGWVGRRQEAAIWAGLKELLESGQPSRP
ncbi:SRPBCC family protein [Oryzihumus sp.]|uniref:SRPBCC family protein n=1 Tax=Oryzihumus sp. TaxID=1968903 RepID=UPI002ED9CEF3